MRNTENKVDPVQERWQCRNVTFIVLGQEYISRHSEIYTGVEAQKVQTSKTKHCFFI